MLDNYRPELYHQNNLMLNYVILISENPAFVRNTRPTDSACLIYPSLLIDQPDEKKLHDAYRFCSESTYPGFCVSLSLNGPLNDDCLQYLIAFLFIPNYCTINGRAIIGLLGTDKQTLQETRKRLLELSQKQGIENLKVILPQDEIASFFSGTEELINHYIEYIETGNIGNRLLYLSDTGANIPLLYTMIRTAEENIKDKNAMMFKMASEAYSLKNENTLLSKKYTSAVNELNNYKTHIEIIRSSHLAKELQEYYNKEYEVLPLWYKRLGHIIKVLMGKRSFRSLFNDKIKKYKD